MEPFFELLSEQPPTSALGILVKKRGMKTELNPRKVRQNLLGFQALKKEILALAFSLIHSKEGAFKRMHTSTCKSRKKFHHCFAFFLIVFTVTIH